MAWLFRKGDTTSHTQTPERAPLAPWVERGGSKPGEERDDLDDTLQKLQTCRPPKEHLKELEDTFQLQSDAIRQLRTERERLETENRDLHDLLHNIKEFVEWKCPCPPPRSYAAVSRLSNRGRQRIGFQPGESNYSMDGGGSRVGVEVWRDWFDSVRRENGSPWYRPTPQPVHAVPQQQPPHRIICYVKADGRFLGADTQLLAKLNERLGTHNVAMETKPWQPSGPRPVSAATLVFCLNASRLGTDVDAALRDIQENNIILIVMHHRPPHDARISVQSRSVLNSHGDKNTRLIVDALFFEREGLYDCEVNTQAVKDLASFLQGC